MKGVCVLLLVFIVGFHSVLPVLLDGSSLPSQGSSHHPLLENPLKTI